MDIPHEVIDVIRAAAAFEDMVQRVGSAELAEAASRLDTVCLAYLLDRLDDTRARIRLVQDCQRVGPRIDRRDLTIP